LRDYVLQNIPKVKKYVRLIGLWDFSRFASFLALSRECVCACKASAMSILVVHLNTEKSSFQNYTETLSKCWLFDSIWPTNSYTLEVTKVKIGKKKEKKKH